MQVDSKVGRVDLVEIGEIALGIKFGSQHRDLLAESLAGELVGRLGDAPLASAFEDAGDESRVFLFHMGEQLDRQIACVLDKHRLGELGGVEPMGGSSGLTALLLGIDIASRSECAEVLANRAGGDFECFGEVVCGGLAQPLEDH